MPTAGRLAGAVAFLILGLVLAYLCIPNFEEGQVPGWWLPMCGAIGVWAGWVVVGPRTGNGFSTGLGNGWTGVAAVIFWAIFLYSFFEMIKKSMRNSYDGPMEAVVNVFELMYQNVMQIGTVEIGIAALAGGAVAGLFAEFFGKRYT